MKNKSKLKFVVTIVLALAAYGFIFYQFFAKSNFNYIWSVVQQAASLVFIGAIIFGFLMIIAQGYYLKKIFELYNVPISLKEATITWLLTVPTGALTLGVSGPAIIFYKAKQKSSSFHISTIITLSYFVFYVFSLLIFILIVGGSSVYNEVNLKITSKIISIVVLSLAILLFFILFHRPTRSRMIRFAQKFFPKTFSKIDANNLLNLRPGEVFKMLSVAVIGTIFNLSIFILTFYTFHIAQHFTTMLRNFSLTEILSMFSPSGGGLGFVELGLTGILTLTGLSTGEASLVVVTYRLISFWLPALLGFIFLSLKSYSYIKELAKK